MMLLLLLTVAVSVTVVKLSVDDSKVVDGHALHNAGHTFCRLSRSQSSDTCAVQNSASKTLPHRPSWVRVGCAVVGGSVLILGECVGDEIVGATVVEMVGVIEGEAVGGDVHVLHMAGQILSRPPLSHSVTS